MKRVWILMLSIVLLVSLFLPSATATTVAYDDTVGHWAKATIEKWSNNNIVNGYNGKFRPDDYITRGEMAVILNRLMKYQVSASSPFTDLTSGEFYTDAVLKANAAKVMLGYNGKASPMASITREDAFVMISRALKISDVSGYTIKALDAGNISDYAKNAIAAMESQGMIKGRPDGKIYPKDAMTRAETLQVLENIVAKIYSTAGTYSANADGYVIINTPNVVLNNMTINGTLVVGPGVGDGDCTIQNVTVTNGVVVLGGGANSFKVLGNSTISGTLIIDKVDNGTSGGEVRIYTDTGVEIPMVYVEDGSDDIILAGAFTDVVVRGEVNVTLPTGTTVSNLTLEAPANIAGEGTVATATVASTVTGAVSISGNITNLNIQAAATVTLPAGTTVSNLSVDAPAAITGTGTVTQATLTSLAGGTSFQTAPNTTTAPAGTEIIIAGDEITSDGSAITNTGGTSGGGDSGEGYSPITVSGVTLYFSNGAEAAAVISGSGSTATFDLTNTTTYPDAYAIDGLRITTSAATNYVVGSNFITTNAEVTMSDMLAMRGFSSPSVSLSKIRALTNSVSIAGTVTGGSSLTVVFNVGSGAYYEITNNGTTVVATLLDDASIPASFSGVDPVDLLVGNLANTSDTSYTLTATKEAIRADRSYTFAEIEALTLNSLVADFDATFDVDTLGDLTGITYTLSDGTNTVELIMQ